MEDVTIHITIDYDVSRYSKAPELSIVPLRVKERQRDRGRERMNVYVVVVVYVSVVLNKSNYH